VGSEIVAHFNISGRLWTSKENVEKCFSSLQAWRVEAVGSAPEQSGFAEPPPFNEVPGDYDDDIPF
jgi:hypothetical protein